MNASRNNPGPAAARAQPDPPEPGSEPAQRDRRPGGGMLKKLKSRRSQSDKRPVVTEAELRALGADISPDHVLGLRAVTEGRYRGDREGPGGRLRRTGRDRGGPGVTGWGWTGGRPRGDRGLGRTGRYRLWTGTDPEDTRGLGGGSSGIIMSFRLSQKKMK